MQISKFNLTSEGKYFVFVSFERHYSYREVADTLYSEEYRANILASSAILLRPNVDSQIKKIEDIDDGLQEIIGRFSQIPLYVLYSHNFRIRLSDNVNGNAAGVKEIEAEKEEFIGSFRQREMQRFVIESSAIIRVPHKDTFFRTPSQEYSHCFLRVGNIQTKRYVIDSIFFWTLPYLENAGGILTDSWSISSIAFNIPRLLARYVEDINLQADIIKNFHVNMLSTHYNGLRSMSKETKDSLAPWLYMDEKNILGIISAVKTSRSLGNIRNAIKESGFEDKISFLALYKLSEEVNEESLCCLDDNFCEEIDISFDSIQEPPENSTVVQIDEHSFFPVNATDKLITIKIASANISKDFFETYNGNNIIQLHRNAEFDNKTVQRHHGIYLDLSPMLRHQVFLKKLEEIFNSITSFPACIIYPPHQQGKEFVELLSGKLVQKFGRQPRQFCFAELEIASPSQRDEIVNYLRSLEEKEWIMVMDDVSIRGTRLHTYQKDIITNYRGKIHYLVGVARPASQKQWERLKSILAVGGSKLDFVEMVILPDWDRKNCPWCEEKRKLEALISKPVYSELAVKECLHKRAEELTKSETAGLWNNVFLELGKVKKPSFLGGSIFCGKKEISEADLVGSVASTIQHLRNGVEIKGVMYQLQPWHPFYSIIDHHDFLHGDEKFFEPLIKAALIRSCSHGELYATEDKNRQEQKKFIKAFLQGQCLPDEQKTFFIYELYLAMKLGKLPKPNVAEHLRNILENYFTKGTLLPMETKIGEEAGLVGE